MESKNPLTPRQERATAAGAGMKRGQKPANCTGCGTPRNVIRYADRAENLCPDCAALYARYDEASDQLAAILEEAFKPWCIHWTARGLTEQEAYEILGLQAGEISDENRRANE